MIGLTRRTFFAVIPALIFPAFFLGKEKVILFQTYSYTTPYYTHIPKGIFYASKSIVCN